MRLLIISEYIAPVQAIASVRWTKLAKYLAKNHGYDITVLTNQKSYDERLIGFRSYKRDATIAADTQFFQTCLIPSSPGQVVTNTVYNMARGVLNMLKRLASGGNNVDARKTSDTQQPESTTKEGARHVLNGAVTSNATEAIHNVMWTWWANAIARAGVKAKVDWASFDVVVSTYGPSWTHEIAREIKARYPEII